MAEESVPGPAELDRRQHLAAVHDGWATPWEIVASVVTETMDAEIVGVQRIVAGEQNEVYDVALDGAAPVIVRISHRGSQSHEREAWVLGQCAERGILAPRVHVLRRVDVGDGQRSVMVMEKLPGARLCDVDRGGIDAQAVLRELGDWLTGFHAIPVRGYGYIDGAGTGYRATFAEWLNDSLVEAAPVFVDAGRSVGVASSTVRGWVQEAVDTLRATPPRMALIHNDLLANHVLVHEGHLSGVIDFGEVAAEPAVMDFARWDFNEGDRFPVEFLRAGYRDQSLFAAPHDRTHRALWLATGLWLMQWYHTTGFLLGVEAARDRLLAGQ